MTNSLTTNTNDEGRVIYFPVAICFWSTLPKVDSFKKIIREVYKIIVYNNSSLQSENLREYKKSELLHLFIFLSKIIKPPSYAKLKLNLRFSNVEFVFPSVSEIPCADYNIKVLFECLEITTIIKLWCSILNEKHIIVLANQNFLLFSICEALFSLIFPFRWLHTYIPVLPSEQLDYLESPTPYIIGVLSSYADYQFLKDTYPNHVICDVNTSIITGNAVCTLTTNEETKLRKKLQHVKSPEMYEIEDILDTNEASPNYSNLNIEDVCDKRTFSENVQYTFFRILRNPLRNVPRHFHFGNIFDAQSFLDEFAHDDMREFWEKIINTAAFEFFILSFHYLDDSFSKIFKNIIKLSSEDEENFINKAGQFEYTMNLPSTMRIIFSEFENKAKLMNDKEYASDYINRCKALLSNYNTVISMYIKEKNIPNLNTSKHKIFLNKRFTPYVKKRNNLSCDLNNMTITNSVERGSVNNQINPNLRRNSRGLNTTNIVSTSEKSSLLPTVKNFTDNLSMYGKKGFVSFANEILSILTLREINEMGYQFEIMAEITKLLQEIERGKDSTVNDYKEIIEAETENELECFEYQVKTEHTYSPRGSIINLPVSDSYQYYLLVAFHLDAYTDKKFQVLELFITAYDRSKRTFPRIRFFQFLDCFDLSELREVMIKICGLNGENVDKYKLLAKIVNCKKIKYAKSSNHNLLQRSEVKKPKELLVTPEKQSPSYELNEDIGAKSNTVVRESNSMNVRFSYNDNKSSFKKLSLQEMTEITPRSSQFKEGFYGRTDAEKILETLKNNTEAPKEKLVKINLINNYTKIYKTDKDPISLSEDIAVKLLSLLLKNSICKYKPEMITNKVLFEISSSSEFAHIKELVAELQKVNLNKLKDDKFKTCFWLNIYNFLTMFAIIMKKEILINYYEWYRFLKNSYFSIGGYEVSLYEIENCILTSNLASQNIYGEVPEIRQDDKRKVLLISEVNNYVLYCVSKPTKSSPGLQIYFPNNLHEQMKLNTIDFFSKNITVDMDNNILLLSEYLIWIDNKITENLRNYADLLSREFCDFIQSKDKDLSTTIVRYDWTLNFCNLSN